MLSHIRRDKTTGVWVAGLAENVVMEELKRLQNMCVVGAFMCYLLVCKFSLRQ